MELDAILNYYTHAQTRGTAMATSLGDVHPGVEILATAPGPHRPNSSRPSHLRRKCAPLLNLYSFIYIYYVYFVFISFYPFRYIITRSFPYAYLNHSCLSMALYAYVWTSGTLAIRLGPSYINVSLHKRHASMLATHITMQKPLLPNLLYRLTYQHAGSAHHIL